MYISGFVSYRIDKSPSLKFGYMALCSENLGTASAVSHSLFTCRMHLAELYCVF